MIRTHARKRTTLEDVAAEAGVSVATASVAITGKRSGNCRVSPAVAERIRRTARQLGYRPNILAASLSTQRTQTVAMLVKRSTWHNAMFFLASAQRVLRENGFTEIFLMHQDDQLSSEREHVEMCLQRRVEGILIMPLIDLNGQTNCALLNEVYEGERIPVVQLGLGLAGCKAPAVVPDEAAGICQAVEHLHELGHRDIAHLTLHDFADDRPLSPFRHANLRYRAFESAMSTLGLSPRVLSPDNRETRVEKEFENAVAFARRIAESPDRPTAVTCYSDFEAAGLLAGLHDLGLRAPEQMSVIGYGDQQFGRMIRPALTTIAPAYDHMGELATRTLLSMIDGGAGESATIAPSLVKRQSTAPRAA